MPAEISQPTAECPEPWRWHMFDSMSAEVEVGRFLQELIVCVKPNLIVETGTFNGITAEMISKALESNGSGHLITCENDRDRFAFAANRLKDLPRVSLVCESSLSLTVKERIDLLFCDSSPDVRVEEIKHFWGRLSTSSVVLVHDVNTGCHRNLRQRLISELSDVMSIVFLPTPRGLAICQRKA